MAKSFRILEATKLTPVGETSNDTMCKFKIEETDGLNVSIQTQFQTLAEVESGVVSSNLDIERATYNRDLSQAKLDAINTP